MKKNFKEINPELKIGDRVILIHMNDYSIPIGSKGLVTGITPLPKHSKNDPDFGYLMRWFDENEKQISRLSLIPTDDAWVYDKEYYESNDNINESAFDMFSNIESLVEWGEFFTIFSKTELNTICELLELERRTGFFNMITDGGSFLLSGPEYIKDFIRLQSYRKEFDEEEEEVHELILSRAQKVKDIFIRNSMKYLENNGQEVEIPKIQRMMIRLAKTAKKHWINNADKYLNKEIK
jgi:hypothetical protein